jgi:hypothetical protein
VSDGVGEWVVEKEWNGKKGVQNHTFLAPPVRKASHKTQFGLSKGGIRKKRRVKKHKKSAAAVDVITIDDEDDEAQSSVQAAVKQKTRELIIRFDQIVADLIPEARSTAEFLRKVRTRLKALL